MRPKPIMAVLCTVMAALACAGHARAGTYNWTNTVTSPRNWDNAANQTNWTPSGATSYPKAAGDVANLTTDITAAISANLNVAITSGVVNVGDANGTHAFTIAPGTAGRLFMDNSGPNGQINQTATSKGDTISAPITLNGDLDVSNASTNGLTVSGSMSSGLSSGTSTVNLQGTGTGGGTISGIISNGASGGAMGVAVNSTGPWTLSGVNTFTGPVNVAGGTLKMGNAAALGATVTGTTVGSGGMLDVNGQAIGGEALTLNGTGVGGAGALVNNSGTAVTVPGRVTLASPVSIGGTGNMTITNVIDEINGSQSLTKVGAGKITLSGPNTFSGGVYLNAGTLVLATNSAKVSPLGTGTFTINGGALEGSYRQNMSVSNAVLINGNFQWSGQDSSLTLYGNVDLGGATRYLTTTNATTTGAYSTYPFIFAGTNIANGALTLYGGGLKPILFRPAATNGGTFSFGTGPITLAGGGFSFSGPNNRATNTTYVLANPIVVSNAPNNVLDGNDSSVNYNKVVFAGDLTLNGDVSLTYELSGNANGQSGIGNVYWDYAGQIVVTNGDRTIRLWGFQPANSYAQISGNILDDGQPRTLTIAPNSYWRYKSFRLMGTNLLSAGSRLVLNRPYANAARFEFGSSNAVGPLVTVDYGATALMNTGNPADLRFLMSRLANETDARPSKGVVSLMNSAYAGENIDFSQAGLNLDVTLGGGISYAGTVNPLNNTYKFGNGAEDGSIFQVTLRLTNAPSAARKVVIGQPNTAGKFGGQFCYNYTDLLNTNNNYTGGTTVMPDSILWFNATNGTPFGTGPIDLYGTMTPYGSATFQGLVNSIRFRPGGGVYLDNNDYRATPLNDRWGDTAPVALDCGTFRVESRSYGGLVSIAESIGAVTFDGGSQINLIKNGASTITVSMDTLSRAPGSHGTLAIVQELTDALGTGQWAYVRSSAPTVTNGMISPYITSMGSGSKAYFLTITNAVAPYSLDTNVAYGAFNPASSTEIVNIAGAYTMTADDTCWALRHDAVNTTLSMAGKTLTVGSGGLILIRSIISGGTVDVGVAEALICANGNAENNISSVIRGSGGLTMFGLPTCYLALSGNNAALTGGIYVNQGTLTIGNAGALNAVNPNFVNVRANGTLNLAGYSLVVDGLAGEGTVNNGISTLSAAAVAPATLTISNTVSRDFAGLIGNSYSALSIVKAGTGTQTLSGASIYTGTTTVSGGTLVVSGTLGLTPVTVKNGATFAGAGWINGGVTVQDGGHIAPGASPGTMNVGSLTLSDASQLDFELGKPDIAGGTNDLLKVNGDLTLDGVLNVTALPGIGTGTYTLMTYRGLIVNNGLTLGPSSPKGGRIEIDPVLKRVNLVLSFERGSLFFVR